MAFKAFQHEAGKTADFVKPQEPVLSANKPEPKPAGSQADRAIWIALAALGTLTLLLGGLIIFERKDIMAGFARTNMSLEICNTSIRSLQGDLKETSRKLDQNALAIDQINVAGQKFSSGMENIDVYTKELGSQIDMIRRDIASLKQAAATQNSKLQQLERTQREAAVKVGEKEINLP